MTPEEYNIKIKDLRKEREFHQKEANRLAKEMNELVNAIKLITPSDPLCGILRRENEKGNVLLTASSTFRSYHDVYNLLDGSESSAFHSNSVPNSFITASLKNGRSFILNNYMIRGHPLGDNNYHQIKSWKLEGQKEADGQWILLDSHNDDPTRKLQVLLDCNLLALTLR